MSSHGPGSRAAGPAIAFRLIEPAQDRWRAVRKAPRPCPPQASKPGPDPPRTVRSCRIQRAPGQARCRLASRGARTLHYWATAASNGSLALAAEAGLGYVGCQHHAM